MKNSYNELIREYISSLAPGHRLLSESRLAEKVGCSVRTIHTHLSRAAAEGLIIRRKGSGSFIPDTNNKPLSESLSAPESLAEAIRSDIRHGRIRLGDPLPPVKRMAADTGAGPATVIKAYALLRQSGEITKTGKTFHAGTLSDTIGPVRRKRIYFISNGRNGFESLYRYDSFRYAYRSLDREIQRHGCLPLHASPDNFPSLVKEWQKNGTPPDALVMCAFTDRDYRTFLPELNLFNRELGHYRIPVLIDWRHGRLRDRPAESRIITWGNVMRASIKALVDFLLQKNWTQATLFINEGGFTWSFWARSLFILNIVKRMRLLDKDFKFNILLQPSQKDRKHQNLLKNERLPQVLADQYRNDPKTSSILRDTIQVTPDHSRNFESLTDIPVWIFDRSTEAAAALAWLKRQRIKVPEDISIICLEDDPGHLHHGISVCVPDWETIGYQMAHAIIGDYPVAKTDRGFIKTETRVIQKLTTR